MNDVRVLSVRQPWAWCIVKGYKPIENRTWKTQLRGRVLIHAGMKFDWSGYHWVRKNFPHIMLPKMPDFDFGGVVGVASLIACVDHSSSPWFQGKYGFEFAGAAELPFLRCRGNLGLVKATPEQVEHMLKTERR